MKTTIAVILTALVAATPAQGFTQPTLTQREAKMASKQSAELTLGSLVYRSIGTAPVEVSHCSVSGRRGRCRVKVTGLQTCSYVSHVLEVKQDFMVWGTGVRCS